MIACPIEDRLAIEDLLIAYCHAVDSLGDIDDICALFTEDAEYDLSGIGYPHMHGHAGICEFFAGVFSGMAHHAHYLTNFAMTAYAGDTASARAYIIGMGRGKDGSAITLHGRYHWDVVRTAAGWKASRFTMDLLIPPEGSPPVPGSF